MIEIKFWLIVVLCIELPAIGFVIMNAPLMKILRLIGFDWRMAAGIYISTLGLIVQVGRTQNYLEFDAYPIDEWFPLWTLKDIGNSIMLYCVITLGRSLWKKYCEQKGDNHV